MYPGKRVRAQTMCCGLSVEPLCPSQDVRCSRWLLGASSFPRPLRARLRAIFLNRTSFADLALKHITK